MLERAFKWAKIQREVAESMTKTWIEFVPRWRNMWATYKKNASKPNPFRMPDPGKVLTFRRFLQTHPSPERWSIGCIEKPTLEGRF
jgi:hypothetical protein